MPDSKMMAAGYVGIRLLAMLASGSVSVMSTPDHFWSGTFKKKLGTILHNCRSFGDGEPSPVPGSPAAFTTD
ncbi:MAG TPA: hypothetical protein VGL45_12420 [Bradyrhizobium sp.]|jgi:hypothetical protein